jgi:hypothetical protein
VHRRHQARQQATVDFRLKPFFDTYFSQIAVPQRWEEEWEEAGSLISTSTHAKTIGTQA